MFLVSPAVCIIMYLPNTLLSLKKRLEKSPFKYKFKQINTSRSDGTQLQPPPLQKKKNETKGKINMESC